MQQLDFSGPLLKVERADHHINELETLLGRYVAENRKRLSSKHQERAFKQGRSVKFAEPHRHTPTVLGDAIHNLRVSLDHAYCILIEANGHVVHDRTKFPFAGSDWKSSKGFIDGDIKNGSGPSEDVRDFIIKEIQPFPGGKHDLWDLHRLDITDKHQRILPMGSYAFIGSMEVKNPITGEVMGRMRNITTIDCGGLVSGGVAVLKNDVKSAFDVTFGKGQPLEGQPILATMRQLKANVIDALAKLSQFL